MTEWDLRTGDCLDKETGLPSLPDGCIDHVITDPPFEAEAHTLQRRVKRGGGMKDGESALLAAGRSSQAYDGLTMSSEPLDFAPITEEQRYAVAREFGRLAKRWVLVFCQIEAAMLWKKALEDAGLVYRRTCIWVKPDGMPQYSGDRPGMGYETIVAAHTKGRSKWNGGGAHGVFVVNKNTHAKDKTGHQTQKPLALMEKLIKLFTDPDELVLDPFAGSGSTGVAAIRNGRSFVGWELDPKHADAARRRIEGSKEQKAFDFTATEPNEPTDEQKEGTDG